MNAKYSHTTRLNVPNVNFNKMFKDTELTDIFYYIAAQLSAFLNSDSSDKTFGAEQDHT